MDTDERWHLPKDAKDLERVFTAAKSGGPQRVVDQDGVFTVTFDGHTQKDSAQDFLTRGGPDKG